MVLVLGEGTERPRNLPATLTYIYRCTSSETGDRYTQSHEEKDTRSVPGKKTSLAIYCSVNFHEVLTDSSDHLSSFCWGSRKYTEGYFSLSVGRKMK